MGDAGHLTQKTLQTETVGARNLRGMMRQGSKIVLPRNVAREAKNVRFLDGLVRRRLGGIILGTAAAPANGALRFDGGSDRRVEFPYIAPYDLGTKWAIIVHAKTTGTPGATQYLLSKDVTPDHAGQKTFALGINSSRQLLFEMNTSDGTSRGLAGAAGTVVAAATFFSAIVLRDGANLYLHILGAPTAAASRADLGATLSNQSGDQDIMVGLNSNDNGVANFTNEFDGDISFVCIMRDWTSVADVLKYATYQKYPDPMDPRVILHAPFAYDAESGTVAKDWSSFRNDGTLVASPTRVSDISTPLNRVQALTVCEDPTTGTIDNISVIGGVFYADRVRG